LINSLNRLSTFVVQGFIFLSGLKLFLNFRESFNYGKFFVSRLKRVILPYFIVFLIFYIGSTFTKYITPSPTHFLSTFITGKLQSHFYFVIIICQFYLLMPLWRLIYRRGNALLCLTVSLFIMLITNQYLPEIIRVISGYNFTLNSRVFTTYLFYFVAGIFAARYYDEFTLFLIERTKSIVILFLITGAINCVVINVIRRGIYYAYWADNFHALYCIFAILLSLRIALSVSEISRSNKPIVSLTYDASYNVYLIHPLFIGMMNEALNSMGITSLTIRFFLKLIIIPTVSIGICVILEYLKKIFMQKKGT